MQPWKRIDPTEVDTIGWRTMVTKTFIMPDGRSHEFQTYDSENKHYAGIIALTQELQVVVARQFRPGPQLVFEEIPGGAVDPEDRDNFEAAALRELQEETGYVSGKVTYLGKVYKDAYNNATWHYFLAEDCELHAEGQNLDDGEHVDVHLISIAELLDNARQARMTDTEPVLLAYDKLLVLQEEKHAQSN